MPCSSRPAALRQSSDQCGPGARALRLGARRTRSAVSRWAAETRARCPRSRALPRDGGRASALPCAHRRDGSGRVPADARCRSRGPPTRTGTPLSGRRRGSRSSRSAPGRMRESGAAPSVLRQPRARTGPGGGAGPGTARRPPRVAAMRGRTALAPQARALIARGLGDASWVELGRRRARAGAVGATGHTPAPQTGCQGAPAPTAAPVRGGHQAQRAAAPAICCRHAERVGEGRRARGAPSPRCAWADRRAA